MTLPKVLLLGSNLAPEHINHQLQTVAELHTLPDMDDETAPGEIRRMVKEHGPFVVFAVSGSHRLTTQSKCQDVVARRQDIKDVELSADISELGSSSIRAFMR